MSIESKTEQPFGFAQALKVRTHTFRADVGPSMGSTDSAPGPHDLFDASLAACKALTATWYARQKGIALERVEVQVERDDRARSATVSTSSRCVWRSTARSPMRAARACTPPSPAAPSTS
jgi:putative redox protein